MRTFSSFIIVFFVILLIVSIVDTRRHKKAKRKQDPAAKIFAFLDKKKEGKIAVADAKLEIQKILPLSDDKNIDDDHDGFVTPPEFKKFYTAQYIEWKENHLKKN